ncbi:uncharacterized protein TRAVEDRAFT_48789 [Trametes versicolor FP-101664 SS1]|uniref:uncharacterized protein n=1 Tax=Trametes versicolor (strain FP-101664) TaxID=717944 RepID=UPI000462172F|nr:uncharacterized protein TRAVEDRAFT_48789 [Trametes versicolor FP-101664 SS1]EIW57759.1 hypothetical protein TRAVEDRAFT_48789 [Trametes versicolor FP-101664 SS1]
MDIDLTFGAFLVGTLVGLMTLETFHTVACAHVCYFYLVTSYPNPKALSLGVWSIDIAVGLTGMIVVLSQSFFARRVYLVGPSFRFLVLVAVVLLVGELGFFVAATTEAFVIPELFRFQRVTWLISTGTVMAVVADGLLTSVLVTVLRRSNTGMKRTDTIVDLLILYTVSTGLLTSVVDFSSFIFSLVSTNTLIYSAFGIVATKLYANSLLAALNSRKYLAERAAADIFSCSIINVEATRELPGSGQFARALPTIFRLSTIIAQVSPNYVAGSS